MTPRQRAIKKRNLLLGKAEQAARRGNFMVTQLWIERAGKYWPVPYGTLHRIAVIYGKHHNNQYYFHT